MNLFRLMPTLALAFVLAAGVSPAADKPNVNVTSQFHGAKANTGTATFFQEGGRNMLRVSADFKVPDTPAPTWRVVDAKGNIYTLDAFKIKDGEKRRVVVPAYVPDIVRVQVYCAWAQVLLGEAAFPAPVK